MVLLGRFQRQLSALPAAESRIEAVEGASFQPATMLQDLASLRGSAPPEQCKQNKREVNGWLPYKTTNFNIHTDFQKMVWFLP